MNDLNYDLKKDTVSFKQLCERVGLKAMSFNNISYEAINIAGVRIAGRVSFSKFINKCVPPKLSIIAGGINEDVAMYTIEEVESFIQRGIPAVILYSDSKMEQMLAGHDNITVFSKSNKRYIPFGGMDNESVIMFINHLCKMLGKPKAAEYINMCVNLLNYSGKAITYLNLKTFITSGREKLEYFVNGLNINNEIKGRFLAIVRNKNIYIEDVNSVFITFRKGMGIISDESVGLTNIIYSIFNGHSIAINMNLGESEILQLYIYAALKCCTEKLCDFTIVLCNTFISNEKLIRLISENDDIRYKILAGHSPEEFLKKQNESIMKNVDFMLLLTGLNTASALAYEKMFPTIQVKSVNKSSGTSRKMFSFFSENKHRSEMTVTRKEHAISDNVISGLSSTEAIIADMIGNKYIAIKRIQA